VRVLSDDSIESYPERSEEALRTTISRARWHPLHLATQTSTLLPKAEGSKAGTRFINPKVERAKVHCELSRLRNHPARLWKLEHLVVSLAKPT
jgi:hypothetical protein